MSLRTVGVALGVLCALAAAAATAAQDAPRKVNVEAERFSFSPSRIKVAVGEEIEIHLKSADTSHGFKVEGTDIDVEIPKRGKGEAVVRFTGAAEGRFKFECNRMCGAGHHFMRGEIVVDAKGK
jgi:cytochrome c oxidase subunit 2